MSNGSRGSPSPGAAIRHVGWLMTHAHLLRRRAFFVAVVAVLDRGKVDEGLRPGWSPRQESNLYLALRRRLFYPLNYGERHVRMITRKNANRTAVWTARRV
ncbi:hypothetical protein BCEP27_70152 [Burkholderia cepacia]